MVTLLSIVGHIAFFAFLIGMIRPKLVIWWGRRSRRDVLVLYLSLFIASAAGAKLFADSSHDEGQEYLAQLQKEAAEARKERGEAVAPPASVVSAEATPSVASEKTFAPGNAKQQWGMMNITTGSQMGLDTLSQELGSFEEVKVTRYNPAIIKAYYFREADITVYLNVGQHVISHWRLGRASE
jgi:hypothetical protein